jgi:hypothetical protein
MLAWIKRNIIFCGFSFEIRIFNGQSRVTFFVAVFARDARSSTEKYFMELDQAQTEGPGLNRCFESSEFSDPVSADTPDNSRQWWK